jgi:two-component SAPR family response regulator
MPDAIIQRGSRLSLNPRHIKVDVQAVEYLLGQSESKEISTRLLTLIGGDFLPDDLDVVWTKRARASFHERVVRQLSNVARSLMENRQFAEAATLLEVCVKIAPQSEIPREYLARCGREFSAPA